MSCCVLTEETAPYSDISSSEDFSSSESEREGEAEEGKESSEEDGMEESEPSMELPSR